MAKERTGSATERTTVRLTAAQLHWLNMQVKNQSDGAGKALTVSDVIRSCISEAQSSDLHFQRQAAFNIDLAKKLVDTQEKFNYDLTEMIKMGMLNVLRDR